MNCLSGYEPGLSTCKPRFQCKAKERGRERGGMDGWMDGERVGLGGCWWWRGEGEQTPLMVSHSLPSAKHRINAGLLQSHNGKSNSIIPPLFLSLPSLLLSLFHSFFFFFCTRTHAHTHLGLAPYPSPLMGIQTPSHPGNTDSVCSCTKYAFYESPASA